MKKEKRDQIIVLVFLLALTALSLSVYFYGNQPEKPEVSADGSVIGSYSIASLKTLEQPLSCTFDATDGNSKMTGIIKTDGESAYGEFRVESKPLESEFNAFLVMKEDQTYAWTSLENVGYKSKTAKSASRGASVEEQSQLIGSRDKLDLSCKPWEEIDRSLFEVPPSITFLEYNE